MEKDLFNKIFGMSRDEIVPIIQKTARNKKEELILSDRILGGITYSEIMKRYYREDDFIVREKHIRIVQKEIKPLLDRFYKNVEMEMNKDVYTQGRIRTTETDREKRANF